MAKRKATAISVRSSVKDTPKQQLDGSKKKKRTDRGASDKNVSGTSLGKAGDVSNERRKSLRSTPLAAYDFVDSPNPTTKPSSDGKKTNSGKKSKTKSTKTQAAPKSKPQQKTQKKVSEAMVTPKTRTCKAKVIPQIVQQANGSVKKKKDKKLLTPIQQPNLDDISPIVNKASSVKKSPTLAQKRTLRSAERAKTAVDTPTVSFIVPRSNLDNSNDSAIFISPRRTMPRFSTEKTSTPADNPRTEKKTTKQVLKAKNTSTPIDVKPKKQYTAIKKKQSVSPVQRMDTPTSDYCSMELFETPDLSPAKPHAKKRSHSPNPVFSLEEDSNTMSLNKSLDRSYKQRVKRKYENAKKADAKIEEWIDKVNSELEDIENFELSVEG